MQENLGFGTSNILGYAMKKIKQTEAKLATRQENDTSSEDLDQKQKPQEQL